MKTKKADQNKLHFLRFFPFIFSFVYWHKQPEVCKMFCWYQICTLWWKNHTLIFFFLTSFFSYVSPCLSLIACVGHITALLPHSCLACFLAGSLPRQGQIRFNHSKALLAQRKQLQSSALAAMALHKFATRGLEMRPWTHCIPTWKCWRWLENTATRTLHPALKLMYGSPHPVHTCLRVPVHQILPLFALVNSFSVSVCFPSRAGGAPRLCLGTQCRAKAREVLTSPGLGNRIGSICAAAGRGREQDCTRWGGEQGWPKENESSRCGSVTWSTQLWGRRPRNHVMGKVGLQKRPRSLPCL